MGRTPSGANKRSSRKGRQHRKNNLLKMARLRELKALALTNSLSTSNVPPSVPEATTGQFGGSRRKWPGPSPKLEQMKATNSGQPVNRLPSLLVPSTQRKNLMASATTGGRELTASQLFFQSRRGSSSAIKLEMPPSPFTSISNDTAPNVGNTTAKCDDNSEPEMEEEDETPMPVEQLTNQRITCRIVRTNAGNKDLTRRSQLKPTDSVRTDCFVCMNPHRLQPCFPTLTRSDYFFLFTEMLKIPKKASLKYLDNFEHPEVWMGLCHSCRGVLSKAKRLRDEISGLETKLEDCQKEVLIRIEDTLGELSRSTVPYGGDMKAERETLFTIWEHVRNLNCHTENSRKTMSENDDIKDEIDSPSSNSHDYEERSCEMTDERNFVDEDEESESSTKESKILISPTKTEAKIPCTLPHERTPTLFLFDCPSCLDVRVYNVGRYAQHLIIHQRRPFQCTKCSQFFSNEDDLMSQHWPEKHGNVQQHSGERFIKLNFNPGEIWKCVGCYSGFLTEGERDAHGLNCPKSSNFSNSKDHQCKVCNKTFRHFEEWRLHRVLEHPEVDSMSCFYCDESFAEKTIEGLEIRHDKKLVDHIRSVHKNLKTSIYDHVFGCELCGLVCSAGGSEGNADHLLRKHGIPLEEAYTCSICSKQFKSWNNCMSHISSTHFQSGHCICEICGQEFKRPVSLADHKLNIHGVHPEEGSKVFDCPKEGCDYKSVNNCAINKHYRINHEDSRPHTCPHCEMAFKDTGKLQRHIQIHLNKESKPFQCEICGNSFAVKNYLYIHKRLSHEGRAFPSTNKKKPPRKGSRKKQKPNSAVTSDISQQEPDRMEAESSLAAEDATT